MTDNATHHETLCFCFIFQENGNCYTCGSNSFGQLGFPKSGSNHRPCLVKSLEEKVIIHVACGDTFTVAVTAGMSMKRLCCTEQFLLQFPMLGRDYLKLQA